MDRTKKNDAFVRVIIRYIVYYRDNIYFYTHGNETKIPIGPLIVFIQLDRTPMVYSYVFVFLFL